MTNCNRYGIVSVPANEGFEDASITELSFFPWDENGYRPRTEAQVYLGSAGLCVHMSTREEALYAQTTEQLHYVHTNSCMEFFLMPYPREDRRYFNFEINPLGVAYCAIGTARGDRQELTLEDLGEMNIRSVIKRGHHPARAQWEIFYEIPYHLIERYFRVASFSKGDVMRGNFYKCGEEVSKPHFGCWNKIATAQPDFHQPDFFGELCFL